MRAKEMERKQKATEDIANHKKLVTEEIEMLKLCIAFGSQKEAAAAITARYYSGYNTVESLNQTYRHTCSLNYFMNRVVAPIPSDGTVCRSWKIKTIWIINEI